MAKKISVKKYAGVYYTESTVHKWRERPDRIYWVAFKDAGREGPGPADHRPPTKSI